MLKGKQAQRLAAHKAPQYLQVWRSGGSMAMSVGGILPRSWLVVEAQASFEGSDVVILKLRLVTERDDDSTPVAPI